MSYPPSIYPRAICLLVLFCLFHFSLRGQSTRTVGDASSRATGRVWVRGTVSDSIKGDPISFVKIGIRGSSANTTTDENGRFAFQLATGNRVFILSRDGWAEKSVRVRILGPGSIEFKMNEQEAGVSRSESVIIGNTNASNTGRVLIRGTITAKETGEPLFGATVGIRGTSQGAITDPQGNYEFSLNPGQYRIVVQYVGREKVSFQARVVGNGRLDAALREDILRLEQIEIEAEGREQNVNRIIPGVNRLSIRQIEDLPAFMGEVDVIQSLQSLPGVSTVGEGSSGFNVRGGRTDQNLILQDGAMMFNSSHVLGFFSAFNPDATENFTLYKGNVPSQFGGRASSVLDVKMREGNFEKFTVKGGLGVVASRLAVDGPIIKDKTSILIAGRASYSDWILADYKNLDVRQSSAWFYDMNAKLSQKFGEKNKLSLSFYRSSDFFRFSQEFGFAWETDLYNATWNSTITPNFLSTTRFVRGEYASELFDPSGVDAARVTNGMDYDQFSQNFYWDGLESHAFNFGADGVFYDAKPEISNPYNAESGVIAETVNKEKAREFGFFLNDEITISEKFSLSLGLRYSFFQNIGPYQVFTYEEGVPRSLETITDTLNFADGDVIHEYSGLEPRFAFRYKLDENSSIKGSYNRLRQYVHTITNSTAATPTDLLQLSNRYIPPLISDNFSIGYFRNSEDGVFEYSFDLYYRDIDNQLEYKDFVDLLLNNHLETDLLSGIGRSYGMEVYMKKGLGNLTGWLSYTYSRTEVQVDAPDETQRINGGAWYPANFDRPHNFSLVSRLSIGRSSSINWNIAYSTGRPISSIVSNYRIGGVSVPNFSDRNAFRIPDYFRIDLSISLTQDILKEEVQEKMAEKNIDADVTFSVYNILGRRNAYSVFFKKPDDFATTPQPHQLSVLGSAFPAITINFKF